MNKSTLLIFVLVASGQWLSAQKIEVEKRVPEQEFPAVAIEWLGGHFDGRKCKRYYLESDGDTTNFEAKFKWQGECYSVEFFKNGSLKDIEKQVDFKTIPATAQAKINERFRQDFKKSKVKKVQEQTLPGQAGHRYEIEVKGKNSDGTAYFEYLFEEDGKLLKSRKILLPPNNITLY
jgi:hypothetical protein